MRWLAVALALGLAACGHRRPAPDSTARPHYEVGAPYQLGGTWSYPQEQFRYDATGLAERRPDRSGLAADGEPLDPDAMAGSHRTLQLPAIVDVTNLMNGRQVRVRLDDRGPEAASRLLGLSRRAADLLELPASGAVPIRMELDDAASQALREALGGGPRGIVAAPVAAVQQEALPAPGRPSPRRTTSIATAAPDGFAAPSAALEKLPATVRIVPVGPVTLFVRAGQFTTPRYAGALARRLAGLPAQVQRQPGTPPSFAVTVGPYASVAAADRALDQVRAAGVTDPAIVVE